MGSKGIMAFEKTSQVSVSFWIYTEPQRPVRHVLLPLRNNIETVLAKKGINGFIEFELYDKRMDKCNCPSPGGL